MSSSILIPNIKTCHQEEEKIFSLSEFKKINKSNDVVFISINKAMINVCVKELDTFGWYFLTLNFSHAIPLLSNAFIFYN